MTESFEGISFVITLLIFVWLGAVTFLLFRFLTILGRLTKGVSEKDIKTILEEILDETRKRKDFEKEIVDKIKEIEEKGRGDIQKVGLIRYNPFSDTGGNQSFVLALLNGEGSGLVITSLHSRESTRIFAKPVVKGKEEEYEFSKEEKQAIEKALKSGNKS